MKKFLLFLVALSLWAGSSWAVTITIGTGTSTTRYPLNDYYVYSESQMLFLASEITTAGTITHIRWYRSDVGADPSAIGTTEIWLTETSSAVLSGTAWETPGTLVATISNIDLGAGGGWYDITIPGFSYLGVNNLLVSVRTQNAPYTTPHSTWRYTSTTSNYRMRQGNSDTSNPPTLALSYNRPNIQFEILTTTPNLSVVPGTLNFGSVFNGSTSVLPYVLSGTNLTGYPGVITVNAPPNFALSTTGGAPWTSSVTVPYGTATLAGTTISVQFSPTAPNTPYSGNVSNAGGGAPTVNVAVSGSSPCDAYGIFTENFELATFPPTCWAIATTNASYPLTRVATASSFGVGTACVKADFYNASSGTMDLITPPINLTGITDPYLVFDHAYATYATEIDKLEIWTSINNGGTYTLLQTILGGASGPLNTAGATTSAFLPTASQWATKAFSLPAGTNKVKFSCVSAYGNNLYLDMIKVQSGPPVIPGLWKGTVDDNWNTPGNWDDGIVPTIATNVTIPAGCPNYPHILTPVACNRLTIAAGGTVYVIDSFFDIFTEISCSGTLDISGGTTTATGNIYVPITGKLIMSNGTFNVAGIFQTAAYTWSNGTFTLSGGTINMTGTAFFYGGTGSTMSGTCVWNVGGTLQIDNAMWAMTGGTINLLGTEGSPSYFLPPTGAGTATAYNLTINSGLATYIFSRDATVNYDAVINNFTILSGNVSLPSALGTGNPGTFTVGGNLTVAANNTANLTIPAATTFTVTGNTYQSLKSATGYGSIIGYVNGQYNFNVEMEGLAAGKWVLISPPVPGLTAAYFSCQFVQKHDPITNTWIDMNPAEPLVPGIDYALWVHPDAMPAISPCFVINPLTSFTWTGVMNTGPVVAPLLCDDPILEGWNNVGNPYQATIDWNSAGFTKTNVNDAIYLENNGLWASYVAGVGTNGGTQYIAPNQGFFVQCNNIAGGSLGFATSATTHTRTAFFKSDVSNLVRLQASGNNRTDETVIRFTDEATAGFDGNFDARKFSPTVMDYPEIPQIYSTANGKMSINSLPATEMVAVGFKAGIAGSYTINATESSDFTNLVLEDLQTGTFTDLLNKSYTFTHELGNNDSRFILHFAPLALAENQSNPVKIYASHKDVYVSVPANTHGNFTVFNLMGQEIATARIDNIVSKKSIGESGIYIVKVIIEGQVYTQKVIIQ